MPEPVTLHRAPTNCDHCGKKIGTVVYDARATNGSWGYFCPTCFREETSGFLGTGLGQKYSRIGLNAIFRKVDG